MNEMADESAEGRRMSKTSRQSNALVLDWSPRVIERFWSKVEKTETCWTWTAYSNQKGYGMVQNQPSSPLYAHRVSWTLANGPIPPGLFICHRCDNPPCVNPDHLFIGTHMDNMDDMVAKGRQSRPPVQLGINHRLATMPDEIVREVRERFATGTVSAPELAEEYGIAPNTAWTWITGKARAAAGGPVSVGNRDWRSKQYRSMGRAS